MSQGERTTPRRAPQARHARLPRYLRVLEAMPADTRTVSSAEMARAAGVSAAVLRKDMAALQIAGTRGVGYDVATLKARLVDFLGHRGPAEVVVVGSESLIGALDACPAFSGGSMRVVGSVVAESSADDPDQWEIELRTTLRQSKGATVVIAVAPPETDAAVERLVAAGVRNIYSLSPVAVEIPASVSVRTLDLAAELQLTALIDSPTGSSRMTEEVA